MKFLQMHMLFFYMTAQEITNFESRSSKNILIFLLKFFKQNISREFSPISEKTLIKINYI